MDDVGHALQGGASPHKEDNGMSETLRIPAIVVIALPAAGCSLRVADHRASRQARDRQRRQRHRCGLPATSPVTVRMRSPEQMVSGRVACVIIGAGELVPVRDYPSADPILEVRGRDEGPVLPTPDRATLGVRRGATSERTGLDVEWMGAGEERPQGNQPLTWPG